MNLTLGVLASILALLPGLALVASFNFRTRRGGARRPEMPLTAISALVLAIFFAIFVHFVAFWAASGALALGEAIHARFAFRIGPAIRNPLAAGFDALGGKPITFEEGIALFGVLFLEVAAIANFTFGRAFQLVIDTIDYNSQGWVFEHITRPAENGYTPVGHVYTSTMSGRFGIAYKGAVTDIRQDEKGQVLSIALSRPERFLYEIGELSVRSRPPRRWTVWRPETPGTEMIAINHHGKETVGGVVSLDARIINNIVVHCISNKLLEEIDQSLSSSESENTP